MRKAVLAIPMILLIIGGVGYAFYHSYSNLKLSFSDVSVSKIELEPNWQTIYYGITGNLLLAALSVVKSIDLDVAVEIHNPGFLSVGIPSFDYMLYGNDIEIGPGSYPGSITVSAGNTRVSHITQKIAISALEQLATSIVTNGGILDVEIDAKAHLSPLPIDVPFHVTKTVDVYQAVWKKIKDFLGIADERFTTSLNLDQPLTSVNTGQTVRFTGRLARADTDLGIDGATITIYDNDLVGDDYIASGVTDSMGKFTMTWVAKPMDPLDTTVEVYAKFEGDQALKSSKSVQYVMKVVDRKIATTLTLDQPPSTITEGKVVTFVGKLARRDTGAGVTGAVINILDSDIEFDDLVASGTTGNDGRFSIEWTAKPMDPLDRTVEAYAKFEATEDLDGSQSDRFTINIQPIEKARTVLTLDQPPSIVVEGNVIEFTGRLVRAEDNTGIAGASIKVYDSDIEFDDLIISGNTNSDGRFRLEWTAKRMDPLDRTAEVYAKYDGTTELESSRSPTTGHHVVTVQVPTQVATTLTLDPPPSSVSEGSLVTFTGTLVETDTGIPVAGATIKIYDSDIEFDDLVASGTTGNDGRFSIEWTAKKTDWPWDNTAEIYAKFEGNTFYEPSKSSQYTITVS